MKALLAALALATPGSPDTAGSDPYRAQGSDPAWTLTIAGGRMTYESPGSAPVTVAAPSPGTEDGMVHYRTQELDVTIMPGACRDRATGRRYADAVFLTVGREERGGCGGAELAADSLNGTSWHFAEIAGEPTGLTGDIFKDDIYAIDFGPNVFVGYGGCNRFSAGYERTGDVLTIRPPFGRGMRGCREPIMSRENRLLEILVEPVRITFPDARTMVLTGDKGTIKLVRTEEEEEEDE